MPYHRLQGFSRPGMCSSLLFHIFLLFPQARHCPPVWTYSLLPESLHVLFSLEHSSIQLAPPLDLSLNMASSEKPTSNPQVPAGCPPISVSPQYLVLLLLEYSVIHHPLLLLCVTPWGSRGCLYLAHHCAPTTWQSVWHVAGPQLVSYV